MARNALATGAGTGWVIVLSLVTVPVLLRNLGDKAFGAWALLQTFSALTGWASVAALGLGTSVTRSVARHEARADRPSVARVATTGVLTGVWVGVVIGTTLAFIGYAVLIDLLSLGEELRTPFIVASVAAGVQIALDTVAVQCGAVLEGIQRVDLARAGDAVRRTFILGGAAVVAAITGDLGSTAVAAAAGALVGLGLLVAATLPLLRGGRWSGGEARELARYATTLSALTSVGVLHRTMDRFVVGGFLGADAVALVEVATQVQNGPSALQSSSAYVATSSSSFLQSQRNDRATRELLLRGTRYTCLATFPAVAFGMVMAEPLVRVWVGPSRADAAGLVVLALAYLAMTAPVAVASNMLSGMGRAREVLRPAVAAVVINLAVSIVLVQQIGVAGSFVGTIVGGCVVLPLVLRAGLRAAGVSARRLASEAVIPALVPTAVTLAACGLVRLLDLSDVVTLALGAAVAVPLAAAMVWRTFDRAELRGLLGAVSR